MIIHVIRPEMIYSSDQSNCPFYKGSFKSDINIWDKKIVRCMEVSVLSKCPLYKGVRV